MSGDKAGARLWVNAASFYHHRRRTHQSLNTDCPDRGPVRPPDRGMTFESYDVGGLHHYYERLAAQPDWLNASSKRKPWVFGKDSR